MPKLLSQIFTWWNGQTMGTRFFTWRHGDRVGEDQFGNIYYESKPIPPHGKRRWVVYADLAEPSTVPAQWHGWLHHTVEKPPADNVLNHEWQLPHVPNMTGTAKAYRPAGSTLTPEKRHVTTGDYDAWSPE